MLSEEGSLRLNSRTNNDEEREPIRRRVGPIQKLEKRAEQVEEDEILQEVLEEEAAIARLTKAVKNREPVAGPSKRLRLIIASTPDTEEGVNPGRRFENSLENLGGGFLQTDVEGKELEEAERVEDQQEQGEEEEEEDVEEEEEEQEAVNSNEKRPGGESPQKKRRYWKSTKSLVSLKQRPTT
ncbi:hypothetical protein H4Q26_000089 [Puccinia striiformis f. sp. tritici PST-130]|nr:hypothetical protein H4Q26_000089 [Puccinia striiformis f. sp. tritici PST-130]